MPDQEQVSELHTIEDVFDLLDKWRHLPAYQLERLAGVFFALFLPEVLEKVLCKGNTKVKIRQPLIPEFPIRTDNKNDYKLSRRLDYFALSEDDEYAFLIELKTDMESIDESQISFLNYVAKEEVSKMVGGVLEICQATNQKAKYVHLLEDLSQLGLIDHQDGEGTCIRRELDELHKSAIPVDPHVQGWKGKNITQGRVFMELLGRLVPAKISPKVRVVYIQPIPKDSDSSIIPCDWHRVYFDCFANHVKERGPIGLRFAESLRGWEVQAGHVRP